MVLNVLKNVTAYQTGTVISRLVHANAMKNILVLNAAIVS